MKKYCLVSDDSGHEYVIPSDKKKEWHEIYDPIVYDVPEWAKYVEGELFERESLHFTPEQYSEARIDAMKRINME